MQQRGRAGPGVRPRQQRGRAARGAAEATTGARGPLRSRGNSGYSRPGAQPRQLRERATPSAAEAEG